jgi:hypothetical protein
MHSDLAATPDSKVIVVVAAADFVSVDNIKVAFSDAEEGKEAGTEGDKNWSTH